MHGTCTRPQGKRWMLARISAFASFAMSAFLLVSALAGAGPGGASRSMPSAQAQSLR